METVTVTPTFRRDADGNQPPDGTPYDLEAKAVAPGNQLLAWEIGRDIANVQYTAFFQHDIPTETGHRINVRGDELTAYVHRWRSPWTDRIGVAVLAHGASD